MKLTEQVVSDLSVKLGDDVTLAIRRVISIAPPPHLPILTSAIASCIGFMAAELEHMSPEGRESGSAPDPECILLAGLLAARIGIGGRDSIGDAYKDLAILKTAGRAALSQEGE